MNPLLGSWRLVSMEYRYTDGRVRYPYGREASGYIIYTADGRMSATIMSGGRAPFGGDFGRGEALETKAAAFESALAYAGRYEFLVHPQKTFWAMASRLASSQAKIRHPLQYGRLIVH